MKRARLIRGLVLSLGLGLLTTLGSAVGIGAFVDIPAPPAYLPSVSRSFIAAGVPWYMYVSHRFGISRAGWSEITRRGFTLPDASTPVRNMIEKYIGTPQEDPAILLRDFDAENYANLFLKRGGGVYHARPLWGEFAIGHAPDTQPARGPAHPVGCDVGYGWPCVALWFQVRGFEANLSSWGAEIIGGYPVQGVPDPKVMMGCRVIPLRPAWIGIGINTVVFSVVWFAVLFGPAAIRRVRRARKGLCPRCGYDLRHTGAGRPCPECGSMAGAI
jgi:hypothetical protein